MCDTLGNLLFYTNGIYVANHLHEKMLGSDTLNPGPVSDDFYTIGYPLEQGVLILPLPESDSLYYIFHERWPYGNGPDVLFCTIVNMKMNNGDGGIAQKNMEIIIDTLETGGLSAVKHSNGIDWWILVREYKSQSYHKLLLTKDGVSYAGHQAIGVAPYSVEVLGQSVFSPDGKKYVRYGSFSYQIGNYLEYFDFDRCTGMLSSPGFIAHQDSAGSAGAAISSNSRFLYCSSGRYVYQYDFEAEDFAASKDTVAVYDGYLSPFGTRFFLAQLAPNGKIYINTPNGNNVLHVINQPDLKGDSCQFVQHGVQLPTYNSYSMPNFPNYRLGAIPPITPSFSYSTSIDSVFFQNTSIGGIQYEWDFGDGATEMGSMTSHVYAQPGSYPVTLTVSHDCLSEIAVDTVAVVFTGVAEEGGDIIQILPNPVITIVNFILPASVPQATLNLYASTGQPVRTQHITYGWNPVSLTGLVPGLYFYEVLDEGRLLQTGKLVKIE